MPVPRDYDGIDPWHPASEQEYQERQNPADPIGGRSDINLETVTRLNPDVFKDKQGKRAFLGIVVLFIIIGIVVIASIKQ